LNGKGGLEPLFLIPSRLFLTPVQYSHASI